MLIYYSFTILKSLFKHNSLKISITIDIFFIHQAFHKIRTSIIYFKYWVLCFFRIKGITIKMGKECAFTFVEKGCSGSNCFFNSDIRQLVRNFNHLLAFNYKIISKVNTKLLYQKLNLKYTKFIPKESFIA